MSFQMPSPEAVSLGAVFFSPFARDCFKRIMGNDNSRTKVRFFTDETTKCME